MLSSACKRCICNKFNQKNMDAAKSCIQLAERRKETTFQICSPATQFVNLGKKNTTLSFAWTMKYPKISRHIMTCIEISWDLIKYCIIKYHKLETHIITYQMQSNIINQQISSSIIGYNQISSNTIKYHQESRIIKYHQSNIIECSSSIISSYKPHIMKYHEL